MDHFHKKYLMKPIKNFLKDRMVFLGGPRQVEKTTLCLRFLITGSARLDYYRQGEDSLLGRYRYLKLHPLAYTLLKKKQKPLFAIECKTGEKN